MTPSGLHSHGGWDWWAHGFGGPAAAFGAILLQLLRATLGTASRLSNDPVRPSVYAVVALKKNSPLYSYPQNDLYTSVEGILVHEANLLESLLFETFYYHHTHSLQLLACCTIKVQIVALGLRHITSTQVYFADKGPSLGDHI